MVVRRVVIMTIHRVSAAPLVLREGTRIWAKLVAMAAFNAVSLIEGYRFCCDQAIMQAATFAFAKSKHSVRA